MPHPHTSTPAAGPTPVSIAVLLTPPDRPDGRASTGELSDWCGVAPRDVAGLIARYTQPGDLVIELDAHPTITRAARHLDRRLTAIDGQGSPAHQPAGDTQRAGLILAVLPRPDNKRCALPGISASMRAWRTALRDGGYLLTALAPPRSEPDACDDGTSDRATVIAAARTAGLIWQQEFLVITAPLPEDEPRAMPGTAAAAPAALVNGRHRSTHLKLLAFRHDTGGSGA